MTRLFLLALQAHSQAILSNQNATVNPSQFSISVLRVIKLTEVLLLF